jgi:hypothetical protein
LVAWTRQEKALHVIEGTVQSFSQSLHFWNLILIDCPLQNHNRFPLGSANFEQEKSIFGIDCRSSPNQWQTENGEVFINGD